MRISLPRAVVRRSAPRPVRMPLIRGPTPRAVASVCLCPHLLPPASVLRQIAGARRQTRGRVQLMVVLVLIAVIILVARFARKYPGGLKDYWSRRARCSSRGGLSCRRPGQPCWFCRARAPDATAAATVRLHRDTQASRGRIRDGDSTTGRSLVGPGCRNVPTRRSLGRCFATARPLPVGSPNARYPPGVTARGAIRPGHPDLWPELPPWTPWVSPKIQHPSCERCRQAGSSVRPGRRSCRSS
jgi:hypothetical protein